MARCAGSFRDPVLWVVVALLAAAAYLIGYAFASCTVQVRITEDSPGWNCQTMGNHQCGDGR